MLFEADERHGIDAPLGRLIRSLKGVELICKDMDRWDRGKCEETTGCRVQMST